jgi:hypothetical protein
MNSMGVRRDGLDSARLWSVNLGLGQPCRLWGRCVVSCNVRGQIAAPSRHEGLMSFLETRDSTGELLSTNNTHQLVCVEVVGMVWGVLGDH